VNTNARTDPGTRRLLGGPALSAIACCVAALSMTIVLVTPDAVAVRKNRIVLGRSIGPIKLGMTRARVHRVYPFGHSGRLISGPRTFIEKYKRGEITVTYCCGRKLSAEAFSIVTTHPYWSTDEGIGVADSELTLVATYPVQCVTDVPGPTGVDVACVLRDGARTTTFHVNEPVPDTQPSLIDIEGIQVYLGVPPGLSAGR
jgi:hypothetical protein